MKCIAGKSLILRAPVLQRQLIFAATELIQFCIRVSTGWELSGCGMHSNTPARCTFEEVSHVSFAVLPNDLGISLTRLLGTAGHLLHGVAMTSRHTLSVVSA